MNEHVERRLTLAFHERDVREKAKNEREKRKEKEKKEKDKERKDKERGRDLSGSGSGSGQPAFSPSRDRRSAMKERAGWQQERQKGRQVSMKPVRTE